MPTPDTLQLPLSAGDRERLESVIRNDFANDSVDVSRRNKALTRWYKLWRNAQEPLGVPEQERSSFSIPMVLWNIKAKLAKEMDVLLGEESEIVVAGIGEQDAKRVEKVKKWMNWRVKTSLKLFTKLYVYLLQKNVLGTSIAYLYWRTKKRLTRVKVTPPPPPLLARLLGAPQEPPYYVDKEVIEFDGPDFAVEELENWVFPASARTLEDCDHFIRRVYSNVDEILDMTADGTLDVAIVQDKLQDIRKKIESKAAPQNVALSGETLSKEKAQQMGLPLVPSGRGDRLELYNWFGKFRLNASANGEGGDERATEVVVFYSPDLRLVLGASRLVDKFPDGKRPFIMSHAIKDINSIYGIGMAEILEPISLEMDAFHRLAVSAGEGAIGPVIFGTPTAGMRWDKLRLEPYMFVPVADPNAVKVVNLGAGLNLAPYVVLTQELQSFAERLTSLTDPQLGRQFSQPNAPRTYGQQALLQAESNVNLLLDMRLERESLRELLHRIWEMDKRWLAKPVFYRVTESDPQDVLTEEDMQGDYDFDIGPVTAISNRAQKLQEQLQALALTMQMQQIPAALVILRSILVKTGQAEAARFLPDMSQLPIPQPPEQENVQLLQGEIVHASPFDNHVQHLAVHGLLLQGLQEELAEGISVATANPAAPARIEAHIAEHKMMAKVAPMMGAMPMGQPGGAPSNGQPQGPPAPGPAVDGGGQRSPIEQMQDVTAGLLNRGSINLQ